MVDYIENLDKEQKIAFLSVLAHIAHSDGHFDEKERNFIQTIAYSYGISEDVQKEIVRDHTKDEIIKIAASITDRKGKLNLMREIFSISYADGDMSDEEIVAASIIGEAMGLEMEKLQEISLWVIEGIEWQERGLLIFEEQ